MSKPICGARIPTYYPNISWQCEQPIGHAGPHSPALYEHDEEVSADD